MERNKKENINTAITSLLGGYFTYYAPPYVFILLNIARTHCPELFISDLFLACLILLIQLVIYSIPALMIFRKDISKKEFYLIGFWLLMFTLMLPRTFLF